MATPESIRSIALVGHGGAGKTSLVEALLARAGAIGAAGSVEKGNTVCDFDPQERSAGHSLNSALAYAQWQGVKLYFVDTPGYPDFSGPAIAALAAADTALVVINAQTGVELSTERMMKWSAARGLARMIVINKIDADNIDLSGLVRDIRERFGRECMLLDLPAHGRREVIELLEHDAGDADIDSVASAHRALIDQIVEEDESLLARYLEDGQDPSPAEMHAAIEQALRAGHLVPIMFASSRSGAGIGELLQLLTSLAPSPAEGNPPPFYKGPLGAAEPFSALPDPGLHVLAHVFKILPDPYMGRVSIFRVHQGTLKKDMQLFIGSSRRAFKVGHLYRLQGKEYLEVDQLIPGELGAIAKVEDIEIDAELHDSHDEDLIHLLPLEFPKPMQGLAVETKKRGDEQRLFEVLHKLELEDPCFVVERNPGGNETVIRGLGEMHLRAKLERLVSQYKLELATSQPSIPYRETVTKSAEATHRHKKQSGGAGQFGEVALRVEPLARGAGFEFVDAVKGGVIPGVFIPAVEKGVRQALDAGVIAGQQVVDVRVTVFDGKHHAVDSKEVAFVAAGKKAASKAIREAGAIVLEPIVSIQVTTPDSSVGDLTGDLLARRGHVTGTGQGNQGMTQIDGEIPLAEIADYQSKLKSLTGGQGSYAVEFARYAPLPANLQQKLVASYKAEAEEEED